MKKEENQNLSRRSFLAASSTAAVSSLLLSHNSTYANELISKVPNTKLMIVAADPATILAVVGAGLDVAIKLKQLFGKDAKGGDTKLLTKIYEQNIKIITMLEEVLVILGNLGVIIRAGVREGLLNDTKLTLKVAFQRFYATWDVELKNPRDSRIRRQAAEKYVKFFDTITDLGRKIASTEDYGYAHF